MMPDKPTYEQLEDALQLAAELLEETTGECPVSRYDDWVCPADGRFSIEDCEANCDKHPLTQCWRDWLFIGRTEWGDLLRVLLRKPAENSGR